MPSASESFPPTPESVAGARRFTRRTLASWGAEQLDDDVRAVASELATNAVLHARTPFTVTLTLAGDRLRLTLADGSARRPRVRRFDNAESTTGRGLKILTELAETWGVDDDGRGKAVWGEFMLLPAELPAAHAAGTAPLPAASGDPAVDVDVETLLAMWGGDDGDDPGPGSLRGALDVLDALGTAVPLLVGAS